MKYGPLVATRNIKWLCMDSDWGFMQGRRVWIADIVFGVSHRVGTDLAKPCHVGLDAFGEGFGGASGSAASQRYSHFSGIPLKAELPIPGPPSSPK